MSRARTQVDRVLRALEDRPRDITGPDFLGPHTIDGGPPVLRLPSRILDAKAKLHAEGRGRRIVVAGRRARCTLYRLTGATREPPDVTRETAPPGLDPDLFKRPVGVAPPRCAIYDEDGDR